MTAFLSGEMRDTVELVSEGGNLRGEAHNYRVASCWILGIGKGESPCSVSALTADNLVVLLASRACQALPSMAWGEFDVDQSQSALPSINPADDTTRAVTESGEPRKLRR